MVQNHQKGAYIFTLFMENMDYNPKMPSGNLASQKLGIGNSQAQAYFKIIVICLPRGQIHQCLNSTILVFD